MAEITFTPYSNADTDLHSMQFGSIDPRLSRTHYFDGQLLKASDLTRDQIYLDERLLELGQVLGSGIAQGLHVELVDHHWLQVSPGIAIAPSGRVLQLSDKTLQINLQDSSLISGLNDGHYRRFNRGLYAIALKYTDVVDDVAEAYPTDLTSRRTMQVSSYAEGVELALIPLNISLPHGDAIDIRAALVPQLITHDNRFHLLTDDAVVLGIIAIDNARPLWLDLGLLRRPLRNPNTSNALQLDLATHYRELFTDVLTARQRNGRNDNFAARNYFHWLPPFGPIPKGAIDAINGHQSFFPKDFEVAIAPVRRDDLPAIIEESSRLAPIDLSHDADADIMVLVPMSNQAFALRARQLEKGIQDQRSLTNKIPHFDSLALRLFTQPPAHPLDTDSPVWTAIWQELNASELIYVRRPPRTAETNISAVVLARGFELPAATTALPTDTNNLDAELDKAIEEKAAIQAQLTQKNNEISVLQDKTQQLEGALSSDADLNAALTEVEKLKMELAVAASEMAKLQQSNQDAETLKTALAATTDKINKLTAELDLATQKIAELQMTDPAPDAASQQKIQELTNALTDANAKAAALSDEHRALQLNLAETTLRISNLTAQEEQLKKTIEELNGKVNNSDTDLVAAKAERDKLNAQIEALNNQQQTLQTDLTNARQALATTETEARSATLRLSDALTLAQNAQTELNTRNLELTQTRETIASSQAQLDSTEKKIEALLKKLANSSSTLSTLFSLKELAEIRRTDIDNAIQLEKLIGNSDDNIRQAVIHLLTLTPPDYDKALWPSLVSVAKDSPKNLMLLRDQLVELRLPIPLAYMKSGKTLGMTDFDMSAWEEFR